MAEKKRNESGSEKGEKKNDAASKKEEPKETVATGIRGTVKWFSVSRGYGFIYRTDTGEDLFVHQSSIEGTNTTKRVRKSLADGEECQFDVVKTSKGCEAVKVTGPDGAAVKGATRSNRGRYRKRTQSRANSERQRTTSGSKGGKPFRGRGRGRGRGGMRGSGRPFPIDFRRFEPVFDRLYADPYYGFNGGLVPNIYRGRGSPRGRFPPMGGYYPFRERPFPLGPEPMFFRGGRGGWNRGMRPMNGRGRMRMESNRSGGDFGGRGRRRGRSQRTKSGGSYRSTDSLGRNAHGGIAAH